MIVELPVGRIGAERRQRMAFFAFSNNNLAIRTRCAVELGKYDPNVRTSEDVDLCFRAARSQTWVVCREPGMYVRHKARKTLRAMMRQLWGWGINLGRPYAKTGIQGLYLYWVDSTAQAITRQVEIATFPLLVCAFVSDFHLAHALAVAAVLAAVTGHPVPAAVGALLALPLLWRSLRHVRGAGLGLGQTCALAGVHYVANLTFITAAFCGALRCGIVLLPCSILPPSRPGGG